MAHADPDDDLAEAVFQLLAAAFAPSEQGDARLTADLLARLGPAGAARAAATLRSFLALPRRAEGDKADLVRHATLRHVETDAETLRWAAALAERLERGDAA